MPDHPDNDPDIRVTFASLPYAALFRMPHATVPLRKISPTLADVPPEHRRHPHAPRCGFIHPHADLQVIPIASHEEIGGLIGLEFHASGLLYLIFATPEARMEFLPILAKALDPACREALALGRADETSCKVGIRAHHLSANLVLALAKD